ncbi:MAG TPA: ComEC/Rec2 family competence protein [Chitinophagaceae bacterium]|nr:ComEC/Rec2 family competence protein [Chitinophagaceae bacterium]
MAIHAPWFWKKAPFIKLLLGLVAGILLQWNFQADVKTWWLVMTGSCMVVVSFFFIPFFDRYKFIFISGFAATSLFLSIGALLAWHKDIRNEPRWLGNLYKEKDALVVTLDEPLVEKTRSFKANVSVNYLFHDGESIPVKGKLIVYLKKDLPAGQAGSSLPQLTYGSRIIFTRSLQEIKNSGNPGGFDYKRYALFQGITHQVFLKQDEFAVLDGKKMSWFKKFILRSRERVLNIIRKNIPDDKKKGLAEALLIGYKDDLDQRLVQSYTNTGVVHIIAISGLHLGLIYWLLALLLKPLKKWSKIKWLRPILIITGLWLFSILAGAQPSILRSALMFTCIVSGESLSRKTSIYNTLAVSAFILLCINPYWLWDVGFQLSYAAVLSIIIFMQPIYNWFYIKNKVLDLIWKLNAVTLAAQVLTVPLSIYHFHQFPNYFLLTNFVAVPLSSMIVLGEIFLCAISWIPAIALLAGKLLSWMIGLMNSWIERIESLYFSLWDGLQINILQAILLVVFAMGISYWLMEKVKKGLMTGLVGLFGFMALRSYSFFQTGRQEKIIVYNVPQRKAVDFIEGRNYFFMGDPELLADDFVRNFHLKPSRIFFRMEPSDSLDNFRQNSNYIEFLNKKIIWLDSSVHFQPTSNKPVIDLLLISKNPKLYITELAAALVIKQIVFDGSVPAWKIMYWKKDCDSLHIPYYDVTVKGAFVMSLR